MSQLSKNWRLRGISIQDGVPYCKCHLPLVRLTSRTPQNPEKPFWTCPKQRQDPSKCDIFQWEANVPELVDLDGSGSPQTPRKPTTDATSKTVPPTPTTPTAAQTPKAPRYAPETPEQKNKAKIARRLMIEQGLAEANETPPVPTATLRSKPPPPTPKSTFKPKKEKIITPSQDISDDGMDLDQMSDIAEPSHIEGAGRERNEDRGPTTVGHSSKKMGAKSSHDIEVNEEGSPKKKNAALPTRKGQETIDSQWEPINNDKSSPLPVRKQQHSYSETSTPSREVGRTLHAADDDDGDDEDDEPSAPPASASQSPSKMTKNQEADAALIADIERHLADLRRQVADAERKNEYHLKKSRDTDRKMQDALAENETLKDRLNKLERKYKGLEQKCRGLEEQMQHHKTRDLSEE